MSTYRLVVDVRASRDIGAAFAWYETERPGLGLEFLDELQTTYGRIVDGPLKYQTLRAGIRRAQLRLFPYLVYFVADDDTIIVIAVLHASRHPSEWQRRRD